MKTSGVLPCEHVDTLFVEAQQAVSEGLITKKMVVKNAYYGKVPDGGTWPLRSGVRIRGWKLGRIGVPDNGIGFRPLEDALCRTNLCDFQPDVMGHGSEDFYFSLVQKDMRTDWICIDSAAVREMPEEEIEHLEDGMQSASRFVHEEFRRSRYLHFCEHHMLALVGLDDDDAIIVDNEVCDEPMRENGWIWEVRANGEIHEGFVRVNCKPSEIPQIAELSLDMLDYAKQYLQYEDSGYLEGTNLFDVLLADQRMRNRMALQENEAVDSAASQGSWDLVDLSQTYGTEGVLRDYSLRTDIHAPRFFPDVTFNATLADEDWDATDPNTWPRFIRVFPYKPVKSQYAGVKYVVDKNYQRAPFGLSTIFIPRVMSVMNFPDVSGIRGAQKAQGHLTYEGSAIWRNPDWECNVARNKGFWYMSWRFAARPNREEEGYAYFHRIYRGRKLKGNDCAIPTMAAYEDVTPYCYDGMGGSVDSGLGTNVSVDN